MTIEDYIVDNKLTCNVYGYNNELLIGVGTPITHNILANLNKRKWFIEKPSISLYENISLMDEQLIPIVSEENTKKLIEKAKIIVEQILNNPVVFTSLQQIKSYDENTYDHSNKVAYLAVAIGMQLGLSTRELINITVSALTHDIGKCLINEKIINKPGKLTKEEMEIVRKHSEYGNFIMAQHVSLDEIVSKSILFHHENYDGTGYPFGMKDKEIPKEAAILHVCDVFDALVSVRPYKNRMNEYDAVNIIKKDRGTMFDPKIVDLFCSSIQIYKVGSIVELEDGTKIEITRINQDDNGFVTEIEFQRLDIKKQFVKSNLKI